VPETGTLHLEEKRQGGQAQRRPRLERGGPATAAREGPTVAVARRICLRAGEKARFWRNLSLARMYS